MKDYLLRNNVFTFFATAAADDMAMANAVLEAAPVGTVMLGFWGSNAASGLSEYDGVGLAGRHGIYTVCCALATNLSLLSGLIVDLVGAIAAYRLRVQCAPDVTYNASKVYVAMQVVESGDAPGYWQYRQYKVWADPKRGTLPVGWAMGCGLAELAPAIALYFFNSATEQDYLYAGLSGVAYVHPYRQFNNATSNVTAAWDHYLNLTNAALDRLNCSTMVSYTDAFKPFVRATQDAVTRRLLSGAPRCDTLVLGMGRDGLVEVPSNNYRIQVPMPAAPGHNRSALVSHVMTRWPLNFTDLSQPERNAWLAADLRAQVEPHLGQRPLFLSAMALSWAYTPADMAAVFDLLGPEYQPVSVPNLARLLQ
eukprot:m.319128 g.319128  ORF g.319128 m.319128 type:complete len:366 (+) comp19702_c0_seq1:1103-2200(+)